MFNDETELLAAENVLGSVTSATRPATAGTQMPTAPRAAFC